MDSVEKQLNHYLYKRANELHQETKLEQLSKAAEKYPEPLEPDSWTALQCGKHAFQELIDLEHYVTMQLIKNERLEAKVKMLNEILACSDAEHWYSRINELEAENQLLKERVKTLEAQGFEYEKRLEYLGAEATRLIKKAFAYGR